jgi:hypothetical protein
MLLLACDVQASGEYCFTPAPPSCHLNPLSNHHPRTPCTAGTHGPCAIVHYRSLPAVKAARERLLKQQAKPFEVLSSTDKCEECGRLLSCFGRQHRLPAAHVIKPAVEGLTSQSFLIPEEEARRLLHGTEVLHSSAPRDAPLLEHLRSLKRALLERTCYDGSTGVGNRFTGLIERVEVLLPQTSGLLDGVTLRDRRGVSELTVQEDCHAVIFMVADMKRHVLLPGIGAIASSALATRWIEEFRRWKGAAGAPQPAAAAAAAPAAAAAGQAAAPASNAAASGQAGSPSADPAGQGLQPFTFPLLLFMVTADKVFFNQREDAVSRLKACRGDRALQERVVELLQWATDPAPLLADVEEALLERCRGQLSGAEVREIVCRQVATMLNWRKLWQDLEEVAVCLDGGWVEAGWGGGRRAR